MIKPDKSSIPSRKERRDRLLKQNCKEFLNNIPLPFLRILRIGYALHGLINISIQSYRNIAVYIRPYLQETNPSSTTVTSSLQQLLFTVTKTMLLVHAWENSVKPIRMYSEVSRAVSCNIVFFSLPLMNIFESNAYDVYCYSEV